MKEVCGGAFLFQSEEEDSGTAVAPAGDKQAFDGGTEGG